MNDKTVRELVLDEAKALVGTERNQDYGDPQTNFEATAIMWSAYKGVEFTPHDVAVFMMLVKIGRLTRSPWKKDHFVDIAGYAACGGEVRPKKPDPKTASGCMCS